MLFKVSVLAIRLIISFQVIPSSVSFSFLRNHCRRTLLTTMTGTPNSLDSDQQFTSLDDEDFSKAAIEFANLIGKLKTVPRTGWVRRNVPRYESVADHSWRVAALSLLLASRNDLDIAKCMQLAVVHDLAECIVGDIAPDDNVSKEEKHRREQLAATEIARTLAKTAPKSGTNEDGSLAESYLLSIFHEYEQRDSAEARAVKDLDLLDMIIQADEYEQKFGVDLSDFFTSTPPSRFEDAMLASIAQHLHSQRTERVNSSQNTTHIESRISEGLSARDKAFVDEYSQASQLNAEDIVKVVSALRVWDQR
jgi:putative hydrolase of HD superfamily